MSIRHITGHITAEVAEAESVKDRLFGDEELHANTSKARDRNARHEPMDVRQGARMAAPVSRARPVPPAALVVVRTQADVVDTHAGTPTKRPVAHRRH